MSVDWYYIWSFEHGAWWRWDGHGYSPDIAEAGIYPLEIAREIVAGANRYQPLEEPHEAMVPTEEVAEFLESFQ